MKSEYKHKTILSNKQRPKNYLFWVFFLFPFLFFSQNNFNLETILDLKLDNNNKVSIIDSLLKVKDNKSDDLLSFYYHKYASWLNKIQKTEKAIYFQKKAITQIETKSIIDSSFYQNCYYYLGYYLKKNKQYSKSVIAYQKSLNINADSFITSKTYFGLGSYYERINNFYKALEYYQLAYSLLKNNQAKRAILRNWLLKIGVTFQNIRTKKAYMNGIKYCKKADSISKLIPTSLQTKYSIKIFLASYYNRYLLLDIEKSNYYYKQALRIAKISKDNQKISYVYSLMGSLFNTTDYDKSLFYLQKALSFTPKEDTYNRYTIFFNQSITYAHQKNYKKSISLLHKSFGYLINDDLLTINKNIYLELSSSNQLMELRYALPVLGEAYLKYYEENKNPNLLTKSISYFKLADYVIDFLMMNSDEYKSKLFWRKISTDIYGKAIRACYLDNNPEEAFYFMEKNKALLLMEDIATQNYKQTLEVPSKYLEKEKKFIQKLFLLKQVLSNTKNLPKTQIDSFQKEQLDISRKLLIFQDSLYKDQKSLNGPSILSLQELQNNVQKNEVILEYHISIDDGFGIYSNNENGYLLAVTKGKNYFFELNKQTQLREEVAQLNKLVRIPITTQESVEHFKSLSYTVYDKLFPNPEIKNLIKNKKVSIVTDSYLSLLSFEALNTQKDSMHYLIEDCTISYQYSFSFLQNNTKSQSNNTAFLGLAPVSYSCDNLTPLTNSKTELNNLNKFYKGNLFQYQDASKENFLNHLSKSNIIHLATHADAHDSINPWIAFSDAKLTLDELYLHKSNASLVVLSACNTTLGKEEVGEGIMSIARGFFYSGTQSVISSLWNVDDTSTPVIMNAFYQNLANGESKSVALRKAKLDYLNTHSLSEVSPYYWASFILLGKDDVLPSNAVHWEFYLSRLLLFATLFFLFVILKKKKLHRKG